MALLVLVTQAAPHSLLGLSMPQIAAYLSLLKEKEPIE